MKLKLGIDTGGSYTDAVLVDCDTGEIVSKAKAPTTKEDLAIGIEHVLERLRIKRTADICLVCLSTTLATNAVIEGKGAKVGLITIDEPQSHTYPAAYCFNIKGKINVKGCELSPLDTEEAVRFLTSMQGNVEALAISGYASVRNPAYEKKIKDLSQDILGVPVVCAHELTNILGYYERTVTAVLNAKLIPIIKELITATKKILTRKGIKAALVVIKGDGTCMVDSFAEERPIETILSGPAASARGGIALSEENTMFVADMGGTTLDIVPICDHTIPIEGSGAVVGHWKTRVKAMHSRSFGLGGDSYIRMDHKGSLSFGPERVVPLCVAASVYPNLTKELARLKLNSDYHIIKRQETDCLLLFKPENVEGISLEREEREILSCLQQEPHSLLYLGKRMEKDIDSLSIGRLLEADVLQLASLTPTDILHASGEYTQYDQSISQTAAARLARRKGMELSAFLEYAENDFVEWICGAFIESILMEKGWKEECVCDEVIQCLFENRDEKRQLADVKLKLNVPIVGIGAPARIWLGRVADKLNCRVIVPENSEVANAVGTVSGDIKESLEALIRYDLTSKSYIVHLPEQRATFKTLEKAEAFAEKELMLCGKDFAERLGVRQYNAVLSQEQSLPGKSGSLEPFTERKLKVIIAADARNIKQ